MSPLRYNDDESTSGGALLFATGAIAGIAAGMFLAQRFGGLSAITTRVRERFGAGSDVEDQANDEFDLELGEEEEDQLFVAGASDDLSDEDRELEERVLEAYRNDPILGERAVDIGAIGGGVIELTGWVHSDDEVEHAMTLARGVVGVKTVVNRLVAHEDESRYARSARRYASGDPSLTEAQWEGQGVGTGRRRQGSSAEIDRNEDPKQPLAERWQSESEAMRAAADETEGIAERRRHAKKSANVGRTRGEPIAPGGVPKADHVAEL